MKFLLNYRFIFEPNPTWRTAEDFDLALSKAFEGMGYEAENVDTAKENSRIVFLRPIEKIDQDPKEEVKDCPKGCFGCDKCASKKSPLLGEMPRN